MNNNQTVAVDIIEETSQGTLTAYKGKNMKNINYEKIISIVVGLSTADTVSDPVLGVPNLLQCRSDSILSFNVGGSAPNGAVFAMDIYWYSGGPSTQTLFSIRDGSTNSVSFAAEISDSSNKITFYRKDSFSGSLVAVATSSLTLTKSDFIL